MSDQTDNDTAPDEPDDGLTAVPYTGGIALTVLLPSGWQTVVPGDDVRCTDEDIEVLRAHPDFDTPEPVDLAAAIAAMTGPELNALIDTHELDVAKSLLVDERRQAIADALNLTDDTEA